MHTGKNGSEKIPYLDTFHSVQAYDRIILPSCNSMNTKKWAVFTFIVSFCHQTF